MKKKNGFSLLELSVMLLILAICVPPMLGLFNYVMRSAAMEEIMTTATFLAQEIMEQVLPMDFFDMETRDTAGSWDDFDDPFTADYEYLIQANYIYIPPSPTSFNLSDSAAYPAKTDGKYSYVRIVVRVRHKRFTDKEVSLADLVTFRGMLNK